MFGERKRSHDKLYPKGYVEMLEQQQTQLVGGLQETYKQLAKTKTWTGPPLTERDGRFLTHDILVGLGLIQPKREGSDADERFEEDCENVQQRLLARGAPYVLRRASLSTESELDDPKEQFRKSSRRNDSASPHKIFTTQPKPTSPVSVSFPLSAPVSLWLQSPTKQHHLSYLAQPSPLQQNSPIINDTQFWQSQWTMDSSDITNRMRSSFSMETPNVQQKLGDLDQPFSDDGALDRFKTGIGGPMAYCQSQAMSTFDFSMLDFGGSMDPTDMDLNGGIYGMPTVA
ncbi:Fluconazole resistance protein 1 [Elasticomyces elasticus]|nr:Fluconazole resistance protein 1 [Elasticomyces elasticus]KAK3667387.1 Fluconazole resistance protein 1 [Elasticomyces elasticus]KAK4932532.1 Fluconazole resistance protein 1 [Elasticomyces elasticus]KAK5769554.1 Fluconazole resistance protein 1 [Elasticomyces elasticus]